MLSPRQKLIIFLISCKPGIKDIYTLGKMFDRFDFPWDSDGFNSLLDNNLISVSELFDNGTPSHYKVTDHGKETLCKNFRPEEIRDYLKSKGQSSLLLSIFEKYIEKGELHNYPLIS